MPKYLYILPQILYLTQNVENEQRKTKLIVFVTPMMDLLVFVHSILNEIAGLHVQFQTVFLVFGIQFQTGFWVFGIQFQTGFWVFGIQFQTGFLAFSFRQGFWFWHSVSDGFFGFWHSVSDRVLGFWHSVSDRVFGIQFQTGFLVLAFSFRRVFWFLAFSFRQGFGFLAFSFRRGFWFLAFSFRQIFCVVHTYTTRMKLLVLYIQSLSNGVAGFVHFAQSELLLCKLYHISNSYVGQEIVGTGNPSPMYRL